MESLLIALALLAPFPTGEGWWNKDWKYRRPMAVNNRLDHPLGKGFTMQVEFDPDYLGIRDHSRTDLGDWVLIHDGVRIPTHLQPGRATTLLLSFRIVDDIKAGAFDGYFLYYGNPDAVPRKTAPEEVFEFFEDFSRPESLGERFLVDKDLTCTVEKGALLIKESANGRGATTPCRLIFRKFPVLTAFELSFDLEMESSDAAAAGCLVTVDLKEPGVADDSIARKVLVLVGQLGDDEWEVREKATAQLIVIGRPAVARLSESAQSPDAEIKWRSAHILKQIAERTPAPLISAGIVGGDARMPVALNSVIGKNRSSLKYKSGWPVKTRVTLDRDGDGDVKVQWDGRSPQSGQMPGEIREVGFSIFKGTTSPLGTIRISNIVVRRSVEDDSRPTTLIDVEETRP
ncbi:MAG TPA: hypothetical protein VMU54_04970 [Planctomycetota bacterium]|nr:hypothetical protein [Planctomycetota bacterium]